MCSRLPFLFPLSFSNSIFTFRFLSICECRLESSRGRTGEYKMRGYEKWCDVSLCPCDSSVNNINGEDDVFSFSRPRRRVATYPVYLFSLPFWIYSIVLFHQLFHKICLIYVYVYVCESRQGSANRGNLARYTFNITQDHWTRVFVSRQGHAWASRGSIHLASENNARTRQFKGWGGGGQRIHVSTLIQLNVYNIIRYECMCMCVCVYMYTSIHIMYACAFVSCVKM